MISRDTIVAYGNNVRRRRWRTTGHGLVTSMFATGERGLWLDPSDHTTLFQNSAGTVPVRYDGDPVGLILDKSGRSNHMRQTVDAARPVYKTDGTRHWIEADGVAQWMTTSVFTAIAQPWTRVSGLTALSWTNGDFIFAAINNWGSLQQAGVTPQVRMYSGTAGANHVDLPVNTPSVYTEQHNGAASTAQRNRGAISTGNPGANIPTTLSLFASGVGANLGHARLFGVIEVAGLRTEFEVSLLQKFMAEKAGVSF